MRPRSTYMSGNCQLQRSQHVSNIKDTAASIVFLSISKLTKFVVVGITEINDKVGKLSQAHNLLRESENHFTLADVLRGGNSNERLIGSDFVIEVQKQPTTLNDRLKYQKVTVPLDKIMTDRPASELVDELIGTYCQTLDVSS